MFKRAAPFVQVTQIFSILNLLLPLVTQRKFVLN